MFLMSLMTKLNLILTLNDPHNDAYIVFRHATELWQNLGLLVRWNLGV